jgi:protein-S-isoprenylcysteine O-methyltransferase Ste14
LSRLLVTALFATAAVATAVNCVERVQAALDAGTTRNWALVGYWVLKTAVIAAFTFFVAVRPESRRPSRDPVAFIACAAALGLLLALKQPSVGSGTGWLLAGDLVALAAYVWLLASVLALGKCFGILPEARGVVRRGPYRIVRHPVYLGELGAVGGLVIGAFGFWNVVVLAAFYAAQSVRMRLEERVLALEFPEYVDYAAVTPRLLPRVPLVPARIPAASRRAS